METKMKIDARALMVAMPSQYERRSGIYFSASTNKFYFGCITTNDPVGQFYDLNTGEPIQSLPKNMFFVESLVKQRNMNTTVEPDIIAVDVSGVEFKFYKFNTDLTPDGLWVDPNKLLDGILHYYHNSQTHQIDPCEPNLRPVLSEPADFSAQTFRKLVSIKNRTGVIYSHREFI